MPIEGPNLKAKDRDRHSEYVICEDFVFKPTSVDAFSHEAINEGTGVTTVNLKSYTQEISDPQRKLFNFLVSRFHPDPPDEAP